MKHPIKGSKFIFPVKEQEIKPTVKTLANKHSSGHDGISINLIKKVVGISKPLCLIANNSFQSGIFPNNYKISKIIPLFKTGDKNNIKIIGIFLFCLHFPKYLRN